MLLNEQEIALWLHIADEPISFARAIESAVLEKLKEQTPVGSVYRNVVTGDFELLAYDDANHPKGTYSDIYTNPLPPADVVRDAERYRWLRNSGKGDNLIRYDCRGVYLPESSALDTAIDDARNKND